MAGCRYCGARPLGDAKRQRGSLHLAGEPSVVFCKEKRLTLSPFRTKILATLVAHDFASAATLMALKPGATLPSLRVALWHIRQELPDDMEIVNEWGVGYFLRKRKVQLPLVPA